MANETRNRFLNARMITSAVLLVILLAFAFANRDTVKVDWLVFERESRLIYVILGSAAVGAVGGYLFHRSRGHD